jgi:hypothetical protein
MARDVFQMTISNTDVDDKLVALEGIGVTVVQRGTSTPVNIYQRPTGATQGPTPESAATGGPNPFTTGPSGGIEFWCDGPAELDVKRVADRTFGWNALPAAAASIPGSIVAADGTLALSALGADIKRQLAQLGQVIDWWRPASTVVIPSGWEICDGRVITGANHDFVGTGVTGQSITLPDLRNAFVIGALPSNAPEGAVVKAHGAAAGGTDVVGDAPGIAGAGGSNRHLLASAESGQKAVSTGYENQGHSHTVDTQNVGAIEAAAAGGGTAIFSSWATYTTSFPNQNHYHGITGSSAASYHNNMPKFVGLLKLMKVRLS